MCIHAKKNAGPERDKRERDHRLPAARAHIEKVKKATRAQMAGTALNCANFGDAKEPDCFTIMSFSENAAATNVSVLCNHESGPLRSLACMKNNEAGVCSSPAPTPIQCHDSSGNVCGTISCKK